MARKKRSERAVSKEVRLNIDSPLPPMHLTKSRKLPEKWGGRLSSKWTKLGFKSKIMKKLIVLPIILLAGISFSQIQVAKLEGGSVVTKLGMGVSVNAGSSLVRQWIMLNDPNSPVQLSNVGINAVYQGSDYSFRPVGNLDVKEPITAYSIHHVLYDIFGGHIKTLNNTQVSEIKGPTGFDKYSSWYANENQVREYLVCVSYVARVRTLKGAIWQYDFKGIKEQLTILEVNYDESYAPAPNKDK